MKEHDYKDLAAFLKLMVFVVGAMIVMALVAVCFAGCASGGVKIGSMDNERMTFNSEGAGEVLLYPESLPWSVRVSDEMVDRGMAGLAYYTAKWWNEQASRDGVTRTWFEMYGSSAPFLDVTVRKSSQYAYISCAIDGDRIVAAEVVISDDINEFDALIAASLHEFGHALGLDDDYGPPVSVDLNSVMGAGVLSGELTEKDWWMIVTRAEGHR